MASLSPGVETKVVAQAGYGGTIGWLVATLTTYILPAFGVVVPATLAPYITWAATLVIGGVAGWWAKHTPRPAELTAEVLRQIGPLVQDMTQQKQAAVTMSPAPPKVP
jgi:hypothetical protein